MLDPQTDKGALGQNSYQPSKSTAAVDQVQADSAKYGDGDEVNVALYKDQVTVGRMIVPSVLLGAAPTHGIKADFQISKANGLLGLGFPTNPANASRRNLVQTMYDLKMVKHASFALVGPRVDPKLATEIDKKVVMQPRGTFVIGSVDPAYYTGSIAWCPQIVAKNRWIVKLDKILVNGKIAFQDQLALVDTGTSYIVASPSNFTKIQQSIPGAATLEKKPNMFAFPTESLKSVSFVFAGREIELKPQDFGLGGIKDETNRMCSSIVRLPGKWEFENNLWVIGGIFLDNVVTIFDYEERKVGFADVSEKDLSAASGEPLTDDSAALVASDADFVETFTLPYPPAGREISEIVKFEEQPPCQIAVGFTSLDLGSTHPRAIAFATDNHYDSFKLNINACADIDLHSPSMINPDSDTLLRYGKVAWLRTLPNDPNIQTGRLVLGQPYPKGSRLGPPNKFNITFPKPFADAPKVIPWISGLDFSKAVNWRLNAFITKVDANGFELVVDPWADTILYKVDIDWIAHAIIPGIQSGHFSTEQVRGTGAWALNSSGFEKFNHPFAKPPRLVAGLDKFEFGCGRDLRVTTSTKATAEGVEWSMNSVGNTHQYITACSFIAFDSVSPLTITPSSSNKELIKLSRT